MHVSTFYFCKVFRKAVGITFTDCLGRIRVEQAKRLLLNPHLRVSEIAYAVGFQSLTHFNRMFRQLTGESPTRFRDKVTSRAGGLVSGSHALGGLSDLPSDSHMTSMILA
jgi:AraC-like DNA-binding protein